MRHAISELVHHRAHAADASFPLHEVFFHLPEGAIRYVALDVGGWLDATEVLVEAERLTAPARGSRAWGLSLTKEEVEDAPRWAAGTTEHLAHLEAWPPLVVGPFGSTYSPILMYEQLVGSGPAGEAGAAGDAAVTELERATQWLSRPVFCDDGEVGRVEDLLFDDATLHMTHVVVGKGGLLRHEGHAVPFDRVSHMARAHTHLVLAGLSAAVAEAPAPDDLPPA
jgi:hypothetical protein